MTSRRDFKTFDERMNMDSEKHLTRRGFLSDSMKLGAMSTLAWTCSSGWAKQAGVGESYMIACYTRPWAQ